MLNGLKPLAATALCLLGLSAFAENAAAAQWVDSGRTAYFKQSPFSSAWEHTCTTGGTPIQDFPGTCANDPFSGWTTNYNAASASANTRSVIRSTAALRDAVSCFKIACRADIRAFPWCASPGKIIGSLPALLSRNFTPRTWEFLLFPTSIIHSPRTPLRP